VDEPNWAAVVLQESVYLFGGGTSANAQAATIYRVSPRGRVSVGASLPVGEFRSVHRMAKDVAQTTRTSEHLFHSRMRRE
jgi:hypothetical protein